MIHQINWVNTSLNSKKSFTIHLLIFLITTPVIWLVWRLTGSTNQWHLLAIAVWTKGLQFHFLRAIVSKWETFQKLQLWISSKKDILQIRLKNSGLWATR